VLSEPLSAEVKFMSLTVIKKYKTAAGFVPKLATTVMKYLNPQPNDRVLDFGCGDGSLTLDIARVAADGQVMGLDASPSLINTAIELASSSNVANCSFKVEDCAAFSEQTESEVLNGSWHKVFSNAAMHWIMRQPETRMNVLQGAYAALKPGGAFFFEMGGAGNVAEVQVAVIAALVSHGVSVQVAREKIPWFFPDEEWMRDALQAVGFDVEQIELEYRPTKLTPKDDAGKSGLEGWIRLFGASFLEGLKQKDAVVAHICELLDSVITREDGTQWIGYVRLRAIARKRLEVRG
jgi:SAM-dependent methyltransferase